MKQRNIPTNAQEIIHGNIAAYLYLNSNGKPCLRAFYGKQSKPLMNFYYKNEEQRAEALKEFIADREACEKIKAERKAMDKEFRSVSSEKVNVGDIFKASWGYDQTNIDYFQIVEKNKSMVVIREIAAKRRSTGDMTGVSTPDPNNFISEPIKKRLNAYGKFVSIKINQSSRAFLMHPQIINGQKVYEESYYSSYH